MRSSHHEVSPGEFGVCIIVPLASEEAAEAAAHRLRERSAEAGSVGQIGARAQELAGNSQGAAEQRSIHAVKSREALQRRELILLGLIGEAKLILLRKRSGLPSLLARQLVEQDRKSTRLNSSHRCISY